MSFNNFIDIWSEEYPPTIVAIHSKEKKGTPVIDVTNIEKYNNKDYNIYFSVNAVVNEVKQKPKKSDIVEILYAHLDLDPVADGKFSQEMRRKLLELADDIDCTFAIDSGNGIGLFWRLSEQLNQEEVETINKGLINYFREYGADKGTHNVDRIMRLPNTFNYPTLKKLAKGYSKEPTKAKLIKNTDSKYNAEYFNNEFGIDIYGEEDDIFSNVDFPQVNNSIATNEIKTIVDNIELIDTDDMSSIDFAFISDFIQETRTNTKNLDCVPTIEEVRTAIKLKGLHEIRVSKSTDNPNKYDRDDYIKRTIKKAVEKLFNVNDFDVANNSKPFVNSISSLINKYSMSKERLKNMEKNEINIVDEILFKGHITVIVARPNGGKTLLAKHWAKQIAQNGYQLLYIFEDANMNNYKDMSETGFKCGFDVMASFANVGVSAEDILKDISNLADTEENLSKLVLVVDTFKKFVDVLGKDSVKRFYNIMRKITAKGGTVLTLAHANKHLNEDGNLVYDGTNDVKADCDTLYYLYDDGDIHASTRYATLEGDKVRAVNGAKILSFKFDRDNYTAEKIDNVIDTRLLLKRNILVQANQTLVEDVNDAIMNGTTSQKALVEFIQDNSSMGRDKARGFLVTLINHCWQRTKITSSDGKNQYSYSLIPQEDFSFLD
ncbi:hypothetical protein [Poseidonibacter ostreae]|jgi:archaellum biogenesis ATPase FlaH|uniref:Uncharacterized protein n=1 Tax=Poseidonibacter ostreae TaxID=2654171 RepID=A0A6L4WSF7_9BACT|nr:hypothetical protein [Poseidonibacter ostreae]KAB7887137.1 hypothetical protein GA417_03675 [Poseidonibacter ostreae]KAB7888643.1 hypothetical protein GBG19_08515 [Poseidonibacter ostreae]KAB7892310.1 hypothetical protein GBG18_03405 [Poseidonibacter ostreae]